MDNIQLSQANQVYITKQNNNTTVPIQTNATPEPVKDGNDKMKKVLIGLGILGAAGIAVACAIRGKNKNTPNAEEVQKLVKQFQDIDFNKGTAKLKDGTLFTGTVEKVTEKGKISIDYIDGVIQKSTKTTDGVEVVKEYTDGVISKRNGEVKDIKKIQNEVKVQQEKLKKLLANNEITSEEFQKQADEIKFKSNNDKTEIKKVYDTKLEAENKAKAEAERLAKEAQEKAQKEEAERLAREQAEKEAREAHAKIYLNGNAEEYEKFNKFASANNAHIIRLQQGEKIKYAGCIEIMPEQIDDFCEEADGYIKKLTPTADDFICYRESGGETTYLKQVNYQTYLNSNVGDIIQPEPAYAYATFDPEAYGGLGNKYGDYTKAKIIVPKGSRVACSDGSEVIFPRNSKFKLLEKTINEQGKISVTMEYVE